jgi:dTDP-4-dehydrorhamnose reductase
MESDQLAALFRQVRPDALIHTAAIADIDLAETNHDLARAVNVDLTRALVNLCGETDCSFVFCSTDTVFDGEHAPYDEEDVPGPVNYYAETKVQAEETVKSLGAQAVIVRLSLVVGLPVMGSGNSLLARMLPALKAGRSIAVPAHEIRTPVDVITAGRALVELAAGAHPGIFHLAGHDRLTRLEIAQKIARKFGFSSDLVIAQPTNASPARAVRPRDVSLDNTKVCSHLKTPMRTLDEGLSLILETTEKLSR